MQRAPDPLPETPGPFSKLFVWLNQLRRFCLELETRSGLNTMVSRTAVGSRVRANPPAQTTGPTRETISKPVGMFLRGEWAPELDYEAQDVVTVIGGVNQGVYTALAPAPAGTEEPGTVSNGIWMKTGELFTPTVWG
jgi:hypothetical protein